jgi:purine nucleoside phosphorylase
MTSVTNPRAAVEVILARSSHSKPRLGLILGSGLGSVVEAMEDVTTIPYTDLPGFPAQQIPGHGGQFYLGRLNGTLVACLQGHQCCRFLDPRYQARAASLY